MGCRVTSGKQEDVSMPLALGVDVGIAEAGLSLPGSAKPGWTECCCLPVWQFVSLSTKSNENR